MAKWIEVSAESVPSRLRDGVRIGKDLRVFRSGMLTVFVATEEGLLHRCVIPNGTRSNPLGTICCRTIKLSRCCFHRWKSM